jgi:hypothetical protein
VQERTFAQPRNLLRSLSFARSSLLPTPELSCAPRAENPEGQDCSNSGAVVRWERTWGFHANREHLAEARGRTRGPKDLARASAAVVMANVPAAAILKKRAKFLVIF